MTAGLKADALDRNVFIGDFMIKRRTINTASRNWLSKLAAAYRDRESFVFTDDADIGVDPGKHTLRRMGQLALLTKREWAGVVVSLSVSFAGAWIVRAAICAPEPTSKLTSMVAIGALMSTTGGLMAIQILTDRIPPSVRVNREGFVIEWS